MNTISTPGLSMDCFDLSFHHFTKGTKKLLVGNLNMHISKAHHRQNV